MEDLRFALLVIGGCAIVAILAHGLWSLRKNNTDKDNSSGSNARVEPLTNDSSDSRAEGFDEFGLGEVRVVGQSPSDSDRDDPLTNDDAVTDIPRFDTNAEAVVETVDDYPSINDIDQGDSTVVDNASATPPTVEETPVITEVEKNEPPKKLYASVVSNPKPVVKRAADKNEGYQSSDSFQETNIPEPPPFLLNPDDIKPEASEQEVVKEAETTTQEVDEFSLDQAPLNPDQPIEPTIGDDIPAQPVEKKAAPRKRSKSVFKRRIEPTLGEDQMSISFDENAPQVDNEAPISAAETDNANVAQVEQEVLVLNVRAPAEEAIPGAALLPMLLTLGFKFGDQDIFHRHVNSNGKGPVLFSLANMFKPGVFDIDNLENFTTQGISLFMILPIEGDPHQVFNMMHNAARKLAEEFNGQILDGRRSVLTKQGLQQYVEKIREFERQRMIARHDS